MSRATLRLMVFGLLVLAPFLFLDISLAGTLLLLGRVRDCPWPEARAAVSVGQRREAERQRILAGSRRITTDGGLELWETPAGQWWIPKGGEEFLVHDLAEQVTGVYDHPRGGVRAGDVVLDCGANIGLTVKRWLRGGASRVAAIEPEPNNVECLRRNLKQEIARGQVDIVPMGVWHEQGELELKLDASNGAAHSLLRDEGTVGRSIRVPLVTIDELAASLKLERVDLIKMDIEGAERYALEGARETLRRWRPRLVLCVYHLPDDPRALAERVRAARPDYRMECGPCQMGDFGISPHVNFYF